MIIGEGIEFKEGIYIEAELGRMFDVSFIMNEIPKKN